MRLVLIDAGLPKPTTQIPVNDGRRLVGLLDMGWEDYRVAVEYDGDQHRSDRRQYVKDINRLAKFADLGWVVIRVVAEHRPVDVIARARQALARRGYHALASISTANGPAPGRPGRPARDPRRAATRRRATSAGRATRR